jgi:hypothetical protein
MGAEQTGENTPVQIDVDAGMKALLNFGVPDTRGMVYADIFICDKNLLPEKMPYFFNYTRSWVKADGSNAVFRAIVSKRNFKIQDVRINSAYDKGEPYGVWRKVARDDVQKELKDIRDSLMKKFSGRYSRWHPPFASVADFLPKLCCFYRAGYTNEVRGILTDVFSQKTEEGHPEDAIKYVYKTLAQNQWWDITNKPHDTITDLKKELDAYLAQFPNTGKSVYAKIIKRQKIKDGKVQWDGKELTKEEQAWVDELLNLKISGNSTYSVGLLWMLKSTCCSNIDLHGYEVVEKIRGKGLAAVPFLMKLLDSRAIMLHVRPGHLSASVNIAWEEKLGQNGLRPVMLCDVGAFFLENMITAKRWSSTS